MMEKVPYLKEKKTLLGFKETFEFEKIKTYRTSPDYPESNSASVTKIVLFEPI